MQIPPHLLHKQESPFLYPIEMIIYIFVIFLKHLKLKNVKYPI